MLHGTQYYVPTHTVLSFVVTIYPLPHNHTIETEIDSSNICVDCCIIILVIYMRTVYVISQASSS